MDDHLREPVVLLDADGAVVGTMDKLSAHQRATRHLAFSVVLYDADGAMVLQRRADAKHHFAGRWSNACCSHPRPGEPVVSAGRRRVREELGVDCGDLSVQGAFWYHARDPVSELVEHEYDVVLVGPVDAPLDPDPAEVAAIDRMRPAALRAALTADPQRFTPWLPQVVDLALAPPTPVPPAILG